MPPPVHGAGLAGQYIKDSKAIKDSFDCDYINLSTSDTVASIGKGGVKKTLAIIKLYFKVVRAIIKKRYDLHYVTINSKNLGFYKEIIIVFLLKMLRRPIIYHYHNKGVIEGQNNWFLNKLYRFQFKNSKVIQLSPLLYYDISKYVSAVDIYFCPYGIPGTNDVNLKDLHLERANNTVPKILFLSNLMHEKGVYTVLEACSILSKKGIGYRTLFIGAEADVKIEDFNEYISKNCLQKHVFYLGKKYNEEKLEYYRQADIFVFPTYYHNEAFPIVNLEAMQFGLPIISTNEGAIPEVVQDGINGYIISKNDAEKLAEKIEYLINNPIVRHNMGIQGQKLYKERYTLEKFENKIMDIIKEVINSKTEPSHLN